MACSPSQTITVLDYGPSGTSGETNLQLSRGLSPGMVLNAIAATNHRTQFNIKDDYGNNMLHVSVRIDQNVVVFNSFQGSWGAEEKPSLMPIVNGIKYSLHIAYESDGYRIFVNGEEFHFYKHRIYNPASLFESSDGQLFSIHYKLNEPKWAIQPSMNGTFLQEFGCNGKETPHVIQLQGCNPLSWIIITGIVNCNASRIDFNLVDSSGEIIFHFNPRFSENCVIRNSCLGRAWGKEERDGAMVFQQNQKFTLAIDVESHCYKTYVNGEEFITYNHRKSANTVTKVEILNDIKLFKIMYHQ